MSRLLLSPFRHLIGHNVAATLQRPPGCVLVVGDAVATGGTITVDSDTCEIVHTFGADGTFLLDSPGTLPVAYTITGAGTFDGDGSSGTTTVTDTAAVTVASGTVEVRYDPADFASASGHVGVAAWVAANPSKVVRYFPLSDASASGTMEDQGPSGVDGAYGSGITAGTLDGFAAADFTNDPTNDTAIVADAADLDTIDGIFAVVDFDNAPSGTQLIASRDTNGSRQWQFRRTTSGALHFLTIGGGNPARTGTTTLTAGTRWTVGAATIAGTVTLFVNGADDNETGGASSFSTGASPLDIGRIGYAAGVGSGHDGRLASVVLLTGATAADIADLHDAWVGA